jgi:predicted transcriptional regulator
VFNTIKPRGGIALNDLELGEQESKFADFIWRRAPIGSPELVKFAEEEMQWKKSTTYTMLRRLCERGLFKLENAVVQALMSRDEFYGMQARKYIKDTFGGLPQFVTSFIGNRKLSAKQADELIQIILERREEADHEQGIF